MQKERFFELIELHLKKQLSPGEQLELEQALKTDPKLALLFKQLTQPRRLQVSSSELNRKVLKIMEASSDNSTNDSTRTDRRFGRRLLPYAASAVFALLTLSLLWFYLKGPSSGGEYANVVETRNGERTNIILPDGSAVWLNSGSTLSYKTSYGKNNRDIQLSGEAYFEVARNTELPMRINTEDVTVKVIGTSFNVRSYPDENASETSLVEGEIELYVKRPEQAPELVRVVPGEKVRVDHSQGLSADRKPITGADGKTEINNDLRINKSLLRGNNTDKVPAEIAWRENMLAFDAEPLWAATSKLEKWFDVRISIENEELKHIQISGTFREPSVEEVLDLIILSGVDLNYKKDKNLITIY